MPVVNPRRTNETCVPESELCLYRAQTKALLRRYLRLSLEVRAGAVGTREGVLPHAGKVVQTTFF